MFRAVVTKALRQSSQNPRALNIRETPLVCCSERYVSTYLKSKVEEAPEKYTGFEKSYEEWKYVEKLLPPVYVPEPPKDPAAEFASGWRAPNPPKDSVYLIERSKNHMIPVYLDISFRGTRRITRIKNVVGNIFKLEEDIAKYLQPFYKRPVITYVNEPCRTVHIKGDWVDLVKKWVIAQGF